MAMTKRSLLTGGLAIAAGYGALRYGVPAIGSLFMGGLTFEDIKTPAGFRQIPRGNSSISLNPLFGIETEADPEMDALVQTVREDVCSALFETIPQDKGVVPVASFSDYNCPYCRVLTPILEKMAKESNGAIEVTWHELPLLGDLSVLASKAALAAKRQGAYVTFHQRLMRAAFLKTPAYLQRIAKDLGINGDQMAADMQSPEVYAEIRQSYALSKVFGFVGTPVLVVGGTVVQGQIDKKSLMQLIETERADGPTRACTRNADTT